MNMEDLGVIAGGAALITAEWWWDLIYWFPETLKFIGLVATVVYLVVRAVNETIRFMRSKS